jgi:hypothetical protein
VSASLKNPIAQKVIKTVCISHERNNVYETKLLETSYFVSHFKAKLDKGVKTKIGLLLSG